ncbi:P-loop containing nucleoside triphosphate hydrolase protein [Podospora didyma]|uniref:P-loop containing nucleoside triphosphate hydrolase protein n=1 Tax=Podospora didyma TaxID=330526 RepID=A0AAE0NTU5_9PEZI|nr:P-loop containing nucleoside triphosphate hydrolase protein [Podospora didyma]
MSKRKQHDVYIFDSPAQAKRLLCDVSDSTFLNTSNQEGFGADFSKKIKVVVAVSVNLTGPLDLIGEVGVALEKDAVFLQHPEIENVLSSPDGVSGQASTAQIDFTDMERRGSELIQTSLKMYHENAVNFILRREDIAFCASVSSELNILVGCRDFQSAQVSLGEIVADAMGLGETWTMLAVVARSKHIAAEIDTFMGAADDPSSRLAKTTHLLHTRHLNPGAFDVLVFHGDSRPRSADVLLKFDVVLTTYHTLASDWRRGSRVLQDGLWNNVAHWIGNQASQQFKAAEALRTERRWSSQSGTPIQNSKYDLRFLLKFLHFEPFASSDVFDKYLLGPIKDHWQDPDSFRNLRLLLQTICIPRGSSHLNLPESNTEEVEVLLSVEEQKLYDDILQDCREECDKIISSNSDSKRYHVLFAAIMKLRRLCNHGVTSVNQDDNSLFSVKILFCELCGEDEEDPLALLGGLQSCPDCSRQLGTRGSYTPSVLSATSRESSTGVFSPRSPETLGAKDNNAQEPSSSKLTAVVQNIPSSLPDSKNIVFTSWRSTIDMLSTMLFRHGIPYFRIDGRIRHFDRMGIISRFQETNEAPVLLMSIEAGAVGADWRPGLTITAANRVHIVEPQWNPSVEEQAIARALRMGQERTVTIVRYIIKDTLEENILARQKKKRLLAKISLDDGADDDTTRGLDVSL